MPLKENDQFSWEECRVGKNKEESLIRIGCNKEEDIDSIGIVPNNSFKIATTSATNSFLKSKRNVRPILVGYAFGKKKMSTMGIIMAEASKALSTIITATLIDDDSTEEIDNEEISHLNSAINEDIRKELSKSTTNSGKRKGIGRLIETISEPSTTKKRQHKKLMTLQAQNGRQKQQSKRKISSNASGYTYENLDDVSLDSDIAPPSLITLSTSFSFTTATSSKKVFPVNSLCLANIPIQHLAGSSISSRWSITSDGHHTADYQVNATKTKNKHALKSIRVSFVPLDLDSPLEEQHGGQFDVILHKMTEDILCISKLSSDVVPVSMKPTQIVTKAKYSREAFQNIHNHKNNNKISKHETPTLEESQKQAIARVERLNNYKRNHPYCCLVDHPADIKALMSRADMTYVLSYCLQGVTTKSGIPVRNPRFHVLNNEVEDVEFLKRLSQPERYSDALPFSFPFIAKPLTAAGTSQSHKMGIVLGRKGIKDIEAPCLLQEYSNHNGVLYKVYVLGDLVQVFPRISLPNLPGGECTNEQYSFVEFDSQKTYPTQRDFGVENRIRDRGPFNVLKTGNSFHSVTKKQKLDPKLDEMSSVSIGQNHNVQCPFDIVTSDEIRPIASVIRNAFGLELFGFDILVIDKQASNKKEKEILVVDVNYFPSYKEVSEFPSLLAKYLSQRAIEGRFKSFQSR